MTEDIKIRKAHVKARLKLLAYLSKHIGEAPIGDFVYIGQEPFWLNDTESSVVISTLAKIYTNKLKLLKSEEEALR